MPAGAQARLWIFLEGMAQPIRLCNPSPPTAVMLSYSEQRLCPCLHIQKADTFSAYREGPSSQTKHLPERRGDAKRRVSRA